MIKSGIYVVKLLNTSPIYSCAHEKRQGKKGTPLIKGDVKFGKAKDLERRHKNYLKTFGKDNFKFEVVIRTSNINKIEKLIKIKVDEVRIAGVHGRKLEWIRGITVPRLKFWVWSIFIIETLISSVMKIRNEKTTITAI